MRSESSLKREQELGAKVKRELVLYSKKDSSNFSSPASFSFLLSTFFIYFGGLFLCQKRTRVQKRASKTASERKRERES